MSDRLAEVDRPKAHLLETGPEGLVSRIYGQSWLHRLAPHQVGIALALVRGQVEWFLRRSRRAEADRQARAILGPDRSGRDLDRFGRAWLRDRAAHLEISWRPWMQEKIEIEGFDHLEAAAARGRGVLIAGLHLGPLLALPLGLGARGLRVYVAGGHRLDEPRPSGHQGRWTKTQNVWLEEAGCRWVWKGGAFENFLELLGRGDVCWLAWDIQGKVEANFLGRKVHVASGLGKLSKATGAPVLPSISFRDGLGLKGVIDSPLDPDDFESPEAMTAAIGGRLTALAEPVTPQLAYQTRILIEAA